MKIKTTLIVLAVLALANLASLSGQDKPALNLTLEECIARALKNNLNIAVEQMNPELAAISVSQAKEAFSPRFAFNYDNNSEKNPSNWWISGSGTITSKFFDYGASISEAIPTGGSFSLSLQGYKSETNQAFQLINPRYGTTLRFDFTQPLLKNFGPKVSRSQIVQAETNLDIADHQLQSALMDTIYQVQEAYWNLVLAIENCEVKKQSLQLGRDLLSKNKKEVEFGRLAPLEVLNAESVVAQREADLIQAEGLISRSEEVLKTIINLAADKDDRLTSIAPVDKPDFKAGQVVLDQALKEALERRPELKVLRKTLESKGLDLSVARNQNLPALDLKVSYWSPGISGDYLIYPEGDFFSDPIGRIPGSASNSLRDAFKMVYKNWNIGLTLSVPLSSVTTKAALTLAKADLVQAELKLKALEQQVVLDVRDAVRSIETNAKRVNAYRVARELAEKSLDAEEKKLKVGLSTNYFVFEFQDKLSNARSAELKAKIDYVLSAERLERATARSLEARGIKTGA
jgi:outer membrane protein TolC